MSLPYAVALPPVVPEAVSAPSSAPLDVMLGLFLLFVGAKLGEEVARRLGQPAVVGELVGGFLVGPGALALVTPGETAAVLAEIGVVILLFSVGLEVRLDDLLAVGRPAVLTASIAMIRAWLRIWSPDSWNRQRIATAVQRNRRWLQFGGCVLRPLSGVARGREFA